VNIIIKFINPSAIIISTLCIIFFALGKIQRKIQLIIMFAFFSFSGLIINIITQRNYALLLIYMILVIFISAYSNWKMIFQLKNLFIIMLSLYLLHFFIYIIFNEINLFGYSTETGFFSIFLFIMPIIIFFLIKIIFKSKYLKFFISTILFFLSIICISTIIYCYCSGNLSVEMGPQILGVNPNNFGSLYASMLIFLIIYKERNLKIFPNYLILVLFILAIFLSQSRGAILAFIITYILYILMERKKLYYIISISIILVIIYYTTYYILNLNFFKKTELLINAYYSRNLIIISSGRIPLWMSALNFILEGGIFRILFGSGFSSYLNYNVSLYNIPDLQTYAHNHYLHIITQSGLVGLILYLTIIIYICKVSFTLAYKIKDLYAKGIFFMMITYVISDLFGNRFTGISTFFIWPLIAILFNKNDYYTSRYNKL